MGIKNAKFYAVFESLENVAKNFYMKKVIRLQTFKHSTYIFFLQYIHTFAQAGTSSYHHSCRSEQNLHGVRAEIRTWACFIASQCTTI
jgi:hypothetical protein